MLLALIFICILFGLVYVFVQQRYSYWHRHGIPYVAPKFPLGNLTTSEKHLSVHFAEYYRDHRTSHHILGVYFALSPSVLLVDLDLIRRVLITDFQCFQKRGSSFYNEKLDPLSANLVTLDYDRWKPLRSKLTPTFSSVKMKLMFPAVVAVGNEFVKYLKETIKSDNEVELRDFLGRFTTDIIGTCAFGIDCNSLKDPNTEFRVMGKKMFDEPYSTLSKRILFFTYPRLSKLMGVRRYRKDVTEFFLNVVRETVKYREENNVKRNDFMDLLIQLKRTGLTMNDIAAQAYVFFMAGYETSSTTLTYCLHELSLEKNRRVQDKARKEIQTVLERHNGDLTYEALNEMVYCEQIVNETLRKHPPAGLVFRVATKSYKVPNIDYIIPEGMQISIPVLAIHHNPEIYSEPNEFIPERFSPEEIQKRPSCSFLPFGDGPRNCIGLRFGMLQDRVGLVNLLRNFEFSTCSRTEIPLKYSPNKVLLLPTTGVWLKVNPVQADEKDFNSNSINNNLY